MRDRSYFDEAENCRELAATFVDGAEKPFLLSIADAFEDLAVGTCSAPGRVIGPLGNLLTLENLPALDTVRWTPRRKAELVAAVAGHLLSSGEVCERYSLTPEEFRGWQHLVSRSGLRGLRVTRVQAYRATCDRRSSFENQNKR